MTLSHLDQSISAIRARFEKIKAEPSKLKKEFLLEDYGHNLLFLHVLKFLYDPMVTTGISKKRIEKEVQSAGEAAFSASNLKELMDYVQANNSGSGAVLIVVSNFVKGLESEENREFVKQVISKDLKIGLTARTLNKVFISEDGGPFVIEFSPQLAADFQKRQHKITGDFYITQKIDGIRCVAIKDSPGSVVFYTRAGKEILGLDELTQEILSNDRIQVGQVLDGELIISDATDLSVGETFRKTQQTVRKDGVKSGVDFLVFDTLTLAEFARGSSKTPYKERRETLDNLLADSGSIPGKVKPLPVLYQGSDKTMIALKAEEADKAGYEGVMVNTASGLYRTKRTDDLQKVKSFKSADLLCTGVAEGTGKYVGKAGALAVAYKGGTTHVGTGLSDADRKEFFDNPDAVVGRIVEVKYFEETTDSTTGQPSLRFPVFVGVRDDKSEDDINIE